MGAVMSGTEKALAPGAWVAALTPLNDDLSIDQGAYGAYLRWLGDNGADGVVALGTTGEANSFSLEERRSLIASLTKAGLSPDRLMVGTGCCSAPETITLTRAAIDAGFPTVLMLPPFYYKTVSDEGLFQAYARVIEAIRDPRFKMLVYDIPPMTGFPISVALLARLREAFPGIVIGVKNSSGDWSAMEAALKTLPGFQVFAGSEQFLLPTLRAGGPGCISAVANVTSRSLAALMAKARTAEADALQQAATHIRVTLQKFPTIPALKEITAQRTGNARWRLMRPPLVALDPGRAAELTKVARELGVLA